MGMYAKAIAAFVVGGLGALQTQYGGYLGIDAGTVSAIGVVLTSIVVAIVPNSK